MKSTAEIIKDGNIIIEGLFKCPKSHIEGHKPCILCRSRSFLIPFMKEYTRTLLEAFGEEVIGEDEDVLIVKETPETEFLINKMPSSEGRNKFRAEQRLKVKEIIEEVGK